MGTRYADEKIGEITDDEVIFKTGKRFFLKEISKAVHKTAWVNRVIGIFWFLLGCRAIYDFVYAPADHYIGKFILLFVFAGCCRYFVLFVRACNLIVLKAKNGETMHVELIGTNGEYFVEQLNRYIS